MHWENSRVKEKKYWQLDYLWQLHKWRTLGRMWLWIPKLEIARHFHGGVFPKSDLGAHWIAILGFHSPDLIRGLVLRCRLAPKERKSYLTLPKYHRKGNQELTANEYWNRATPCIKFLVLLENINVSSLSFCIKPNPYHNFPLWPLSIQKSLKRLAVAILFLLKSGINVIIKFLKLYSKEKEKRKRRREVDLS